MGSATPRLKAGDVVSIESSRFDPPGRPPGSYSASAPARAFGVVLGRTRAEGCFTVRWREGDPMESPWHHLRLEPEDGSVPKQRQDEAAAAFRRRVEKHVTEADRNAKKRRKDDEARRAKHFALRVQNHDAATPPVQKKNEKGHRFNERKRRFENRVRPTLDEPRYHRHRNAAAAGAAARRAPQI